MRHWKLFILTVMLIGGSTPATAVGQDLSTPEPADVVTVSGSITVEDRALFQWIEDVDCRVSFGGYDPIPVLRVLDEAGHEVESLDIGTIRGTGDMVPIPEEELAAYEEEYGEERERTERLGSCTISYEIDIPDSGSYDVVIDPVFEETIHIPDIAEQAYVLDILPEFADGDNLPSIFERPSGHLAGTDTYRIAGTFTLNGEWGEDFLNLGLGGCRGMGGYDDFEPGAQLIIRDASGDIIQTTLLMDPGMGTEVELETCLLYFTADVEESTFYTIEMGRRGEIAYSFDDLEERDWRVDLSLN